jgi:hypothetical protein
VGTSFFVRVKPTTIPDKKKLRGFPIADADDSPTDFYIHTATGRVMPFLIPYNGYTIAALFLSTCARNRNY